MYLAVDIKLVDRSTEGCPQLARCAREVDHDAARINLVDAEAMRFEPVGDGLDIFLRHAEPLAKFLGRKPMMEIRRLAVVERVDKLINRSFLPGRTLQQQEHVIDVEGVGDRAAIEGGVRLRARIARQRYPLVLVNLLRNPRAIRHLRDACRSFFALRIGEISGEQEAGRQH